MEADLNILSGQNESLFPPDAIIKVENLHTYFYTDLGISRALNGVSFTVPTGKVLGVVGESGCGKSVTALIHYATCSASRAHDPRENSSSHWRGRVTRSLILLSSIATAVQCAIYAAGKSA